MTLFWFTAANILLGCLSGYGYVRTAGLSPGVPGWAFAVAATFGQVALAFLLAGALLAALGSFPPAGRRMAWLAPALFAVLHFFLYIDKLIFRLFRFHWNGLVWNVLTTPGGWESMHISVGDMATGAVAACLLAGGEVGLYLWLESRFRKRAAPGLGRRWAALAGLVLGSVALDHLVYAYGDLFNVRTITRAAKVAPFYQPLTVKKLARRLGGIRVDRELELKVDEGGGALLYPREPLRSDRPRKLYNMVWVVLDGWRADALTPEVTPNLTAFSRRAQVFTDHWSGGNATRFGIFSIFYGIYGTYWQSFLGERRGPVLFDRLIELGYRFKILSSTSLTFPEFRKTAFVRVADSIEDDLPGPSAAERDAAMVERTRAFLDGLKPGEPFFTFLFTDSTHAGYYFPKEFAKFRPYPETLEYLKLGSGTDPRQPHNRYLNAVHYNDHLVGELLRDLEKRGRLKDTVVLVTGDHGEEFFEHGAWGHNGNFSREEIQVPLLLYLPDRPGARWSHRTSHHDLASTFLGMLGVRNPPGDYSLGRPLFEAGGRPFAVSASWDEFALIAPDATFVFPAESHGGVGGIDVLGPDYKDAPDRKGLLDRHARHLADLLSQMTAFLKK